jgi:hypothetical protein
MADIKITGSNSNQFAGNDYEVPDARANQSSVTFHSANAAVQICFTNYDTFGTWGLPVPQGGSSTSITLAQAVPTGFCIQTSGTTCTSSTCSNNPKGVTTYDITMGSSLPGGKGPRPGKK